MPLSEGLLRDAPPAESRVSRGTEESNLMSELDCLGVAGPSNSLQRETGPFQQRGSDSNSWQRDCVAGKQEKD